MMLTVDSLVSGFDAEPVVRGVSVQVAPGEIVCLVGPNGAGKSAFMKTVVGELAVRHGEITLGEERLTRFTFDQRIRKGIGYVPQLRRVFPTLTVRENLEMGAYSVKGSLRDRFDRVYELFPELLANTKRQGGVLSGGQQSMLGMARALMGDAQVLLLDEVTVGLSPAYVDEVWGKIASLRDSGLGLLLVEQNVSVALDHADIMYVLVEGKVVAHDTCGNLKGRQDVEGLFVG